jgi:hypothetical protein
MNEQKSCLQRQPVSFMRSICSYAKANITLVELIMKWKPWEQSIGAGIHESNASVSQNA